VYFLTIRKSATPTESRQHFSSENVDGNVNSFLFEDAQQTPSKTRSMDPISGCALHFSKETKPFCKDEENHKIYFVRYTP